MIDLPQIAVDYARLGQLSEQQLGACRDRLSAAERVELARLKDPGRRREWLGGRFLAKRLISGVLACGTDVPIEILSRDGSRAMRPQVRIGEGRETWWVSISHTAAGVLAAVCLHPRCALGVDLVVVEPRLDRSLGFWLTDQERHWTEGAGAAGMAAVWAVKEAVYKAANDGEPFAPRRIGVHLRDGSRYECSYRGRRLDAIAEIRTVLHDGQVAAFALLRRPGDYGRWVAATHLAGVSHD